MRGSTKPWETWEKNRTAFLYKRSTQNTDGGKDETEIRGYIKKMFMDHPAIKKLVWYTPEEKDEEKPRRRQIASKTNPSPFIPLFLCSIYTLHLHGWLSVKHCSLTAGMFWLPTSGGLSVCSTYVFACGCVFTDSHDRSYDCVGFLWWNFLPQPDMLVRWNCTQWL